MLRRLLIFPLMPLLFVGDYAGEGRRMVLGDDRRVEARAVPLDPTRPALRRAGRLVFLEGWELRGRDPAFGSFSAMAVRDRSFLFIGDSGGIVRLRLGAKGEVEAVRFGDLAEGPGRGWTKRDRDAEAMAIDPATGRIWIAYERHDAIWRYAPGFARAEARAAPAAMQPWPNNGGAEAMVRLRSGAFIVFSESGEERDGASAALLFDRDPTDPRARITRFHHRPPHGYRATDAAELPDGRVLMLYRRLVFPTAFAAKLAVLDPARIRAGAIVRGEEIAKLAPPMSVDNMEALAVEREGDGSIAVWIASDHNFTPLLQRTLLLKFRLELQEAQFT